MAKPQQGHFKAAEAMPKIIREFRVDEITEDLKVGETFDPEVFSVGDEIDVTGTSKGKGWAGTIKRHNFHRRSQDSRWSLIPTPRFYRFYVPSAYFQGKEDGWSNGS